MLEEKRWLPCALAQAERSKGKTKLGQLWIQLGRAPDSLKKTDVQISRCFSRFHHYACCDLYKCYCSLRAARLRTFSRPGGKFIKIMCHIIVVAIIKILTQTTIMKLLNRFSPELAHIVWKNGDLAARLLQVASLSSIQLSVPHKDA